MEKNGDSIDLYTRWKHDEQLLQRRSPPSSVPKAIPFKSDTSKFLVPTIGQVLYTDGYSSMKQDDYYERTLFDEEMEIPSIGTDQKNFDLAEMVTFDISGTSTRLPLMCKMIIYKQGATHEREPPILVRDVCVQWNGIDRPRRNSMDCLSSKRKQKYEYTLERARSSDDLLDKQVKSAARRYLDDTNRCVSMASSMTDDDDAASIVTVGGTIRHRVSHLLYRHRYLRQIDANLLGCHEFYSVPFYQYRGRRYGQKSIGIQMNESDLINSLHQRENSDAPSYSITIIFPVRDRNKTIGTHLKESRLLNVNIPANNRTKHTIIGYLNTKEFITIKRTIHGHIVDA
ncbi:unnamed protein product [Rotaria magnacalcarata]|uniref:Uncharacterized protein n=1 Tax=Rotaria magnacalcarata TaxID=392030 RepID=A0A816W0B8_9BILA|nr:unnamed protein product [Rotaria magnacalcarata]CAF1291664.1 unnamed protein product [Rotaria magnacalcarata]CAF2131272.1 unnamed protein product [Rotaria magnacalcarata]CAF2132382.1 unnamed protein product [Rotaria magnacalcarata]CAF2148064.1 unnamed protein product [Rotaria magnacalcarata]